MCLAIPAQVCELLDDELQFATIDILGVRRRANIELLQHDPPAVGDWVLVHVGFAMSKISAEYAEEQLQLLSMLGEAEEPLSTEPAAGPAADNTAAEPGHEVR